MAYTQDHKTEEYLRLIAEFVLKHKQRTYELMQIQPGHTVLDMGLPRVLSDGSFSAWLTNKG